MGKTGKKRAGVAKLELRVKSKGAVQKSTDGWVVQSVSGLPAEGEISYTLQKLLVIDVPAFMEVPLFRLPKIGLKYRRWAVGHPPLEHQNRAG